MTACCCKNMTRPVAVVHGIVVASCQVQLFSCNIPSFSSQRRRVTEKHVLIGRKDDMLGNQTFERFIRYLSHISLIGRVAAI